MIIEHDLVVLTADYRARRLHPGDVGTVVHVYPEGDAYEVEFVAGNGETIAVLTLSAAEVRRIGPTEVLHTRQVDHQAITQGLAELEAGKGMSVEQARLLTQERLLFRKP